MKVLLSSALAAAGLSIGPFYGLEGQIGPTGAWEGFEARGSVLFVLVVRRAAPAPCPRWSRAVEEYGRRGLGGFSLDGPSPGFEDGSSDAWAAWTPWSEEDLEAVAECDELPCDVKTDAGETAALAALPEEGRKARWVRLVAERTGRFWRGGRREATEFDGVPADPWEALRGFLGGPGGAPPARDASTRRRLHVRKLDFAPGKLRPLRQTLESLTRAAERTSSVWVRDAYTAHYFDSWGEWLQIECGRNEVSGAQALVVDLDLLKKGDLISRLARPRMRSAVRDRGREYLNQQWRVLDGFLNSFQEIRSVPGGGKRPRRRASDPR